MIQGSSVSVGYRIQGSSVSVWYREVVLVYDTFGFLSDIYEGYSLLYSINVRENQRSNIKKDNPEKPAT
jgi:hypothetical protein